MFFFFILRQGRFCGVLLVVFIEKFETSWEVLQSPKLGFFSSVSEFEKRANVMAKKETVQLRTTLKVSKVHIQWLGCLILSNIKVFCRWKSSNDASDSIFFSFVLKCWEKGQCYGLERNCPTQNNVKSLESSHPTTEWSHFEQY